MKSTSSIEYYKRELYRIAWRIQHKQRIQYKKELPLKIEMIKNSISNDEIIEKIHINELLASLPSPTGRKIIYKIYILDMTTSQIAKELHISQQAVSKWKKKMLTYLYQKRTL
ncbi:sigma factor-like helix-turn-helix DNA-binding protein [Paenibacillus sp. FSL M7-0420]|uniref:sigma factor-like helix-turn-helix DNA-binding protein n=1 Tax=Paenibacillus sp. FSL M7-0420 TaxID=2921609 RepID=UPI0030F66C96